MSEMRSTPQRSGEIDLTEFFRWVGRGFSRIGGNIFSFIAALRNIFFKNRLFFAGMILIGLALGALYSQLLKRTYFKSTMVLQCEYLTAPNMQSTIEMLNMLAAEPDREGLAQVLNIDIALAKNIFKFEFKSLVLEDDIIEMEILRSQLNTLNAERKDIVDQVIEKLEIANKNAFEISALVFEPAVVRPLEKAVIEYLRNTAYIKRRIEINKLSLTHRREKLLSESAKLDSLKRAILQSYQDLRSVSKGSLNVIFGNEKLQNPLEVFTTDLTVNEEILRIEEELYLNSDFELVSGFTAFKRPESPGLAVILFVSFWISLLSGYIIIGLWRLDEKLAKHGA